jgi:type IV pilus biogenesis protein CpaD/CtpE
MNTKTLSRWALVATAVLLAGCADRSIYEGPGDSKFGEANRQTMMAQVVNPDPVYDTDMATSGDHAEQAIERYRTDKVKQPDNIKTTDVGTGSGPN